MNHRWGPKTVVTIHKTERVCQNCGMVEASRHEHHSHWKEYWRDLEKVSVNRVPPCDAMSAT